MEELYQTGISASDWSKGISLSVLASVIGGASKLAIRKSWLLENARTRAENEGDQDDVNRSSSSLTQPLTFDSVCGSACRTLCLESQDLNNSRNEDVEGEEGDSDDDNSVQTRRRKSSILSLTLRYSGMFGMSVLNPICCVLAMNYASPSILAPFSGLTLVWVILFSYPVVGEQPSIPQIIAACLIVSGEVIVAVFGDHTNDEDMSVRDVRDSYLEPEFLAYLVALTLYMGLVYYWINFSENSTLRRFAWGTCGGSLTGLQNFLKDSLTLHKAIGRGEPSPWFFPLLMMLAGATAFIGLLLLTACMKRYDATYSSSTFVGSFVVSASIMSAAHYNTFAQLQSLKNYVLYPTGLLTLMVGVYLLVKNTKDSDEDSESNNDVEVEPIRKNSADSQQVCKAIGTILTLH